MNHGVELTAAATLDALLAERDVDADEVVEDFKTARSATTHSNHELLGRCFARTRNCQGHPAYSLLYGKEIIMTSLIAALKALPEALKSVRTMSFEWFACLAAMLTIAACWNHLHPNEIIATVAHIMRWESVTVWFTSGIPEFLIVGISGAGGFLILIVACLICAMSVQPARRVRKEGFEIKFEVQGLIDARAAGSVWILLLAATQLEPVGLVIQQLCVASIVGIVFIFILLASCVFLYIITGRGHHNDDHFVTPSQKIFWFLRDLLIASFFVPIALISAAFSPIFSILSRYASTESDFMCKEKRKIERERAEEQQPTGAIPVDINGMRARIEAYS